MKFEGGIKKKQKKKTRKFESQESGKEHKTMEGRFLISFGELPNIVDKQGWLFF